MKDLKFQEDYNTVLAKLEKGSLDIAELIVQEAEVQEKEEEIVPPERPKTPEEEIIPEQKKDELETSCKNREKFIKLQTLAKKPVRRMKAAEKIAEPKWEHLAHGEAKDNFLVLKQLYLKNLNSKEFSTNLENFEEHIDIKNSMREGFIKYRGGPPWDLSEEEKDLLITVDNFHNLSPMLQLAFLVEQLKVQKSRLRSLSEEERRSLDDFGRTAADRYRLLKNFAKDIWYLIFKKTTGSEEMVGGKLMVERST